MAETVCTPQAFILDASITLSWFFENERNDYALSVLESLRHTSCIVPSIWPLEVANALLMGERRKRGSESKTTQCTHALNDLPIVVANHDGRSTLETVPPIARLHRLTAYDCAYLELAISLNLPLSTLDGSLLHAAKDAGVFLYQPSSEMISTGAARTM